MYKNYIFDLYGTLVDIHTDEESPLLWEKMADFYSVYGADYEPGELRKAYLRMVEEEEKAAADSENPGETEEADKPDPAEPRDDGEATVTAAEQQK